MMSMEDLRKTLRVVNVEDESAMRLQIGELNKWINQTKQKLNGVKSSEEASKQIALTTDEIKAFMNYEAIETFESMKKTKFLISSLDFVMRQLQERGKDKADIQDCLMSAILNLDCLARVFQGNEEEKTAPTFASKKDFKSTIYHPSRIENTSFGDAQKTRREMDRLIQENQKLKASLQEEKHAKEDALTRLSTLAGNKMKVGNPDIADLSDPNRPLKLSDEFGELYCNEWTDALEYLQKKATKGKSAFAGYHTIHVHGRQLEVQEKGSIDLLLEVLEKCYAISREDADCQRIAILNAVTGKAELDKLTKGVASRTVAADHGLSRLILTPLKFPEQEKDIRADDAHNNLNNAIREFQRNLGTQTVKFMPKIIAQKAVSKIREDHTEKYLENLYNPDDDQLSIYVDKCAQLCWLMRIQFPPVHLKFDIQGDFDGTFCTPYLTSGEKVLFPVWPAMFLNEDNGALIRKGVVECTKKI